MWRRHESILVSRVSWFHPAPYREPVKGSSAEQPAATSCAQGNDRCVILRLSTLLDVIILYQTGCSDSPRSTPFAGLRAVLSSGVCLLFHTDHLGSRGAGLPFFLILLRSENPTPASSSQ